MNFMIATQTQTHLRPALRRAVLFLLVTGLAGALPLRAGEPVDPAPFIAPTLAVIDIINNTSDLQPFVAGMPDMLITELLRVGDVKLVERTKIQTAMKALKLEASDLTADGNLQLGKWLGANALVLGTFNLIGDQYRLDLRVIEVTTGTISIAASCVKPRHLIMELIPEAGAQLRARLLGDQARLAGGGRPVVVETDSARVRIEFKMVVGLLTERNVSFQKVRVLLDGRPWGESGVIDRINDRFIVYEGRVPAGPHAITLQHGTVNRAGGWRASLESQPAMYQGRFEKEQSYLLSYRMVAEPLNDRFSEIRVLQ